MSKQASITFTTPVGRLLWGSLVRAKTKDSEGKPLVIKSGPNAGQPTQRYEFGLGIKKNHPQERWQDTEWGKIIVKAGTDAFPGGQHALPVFAWKVTDGDSGIPNRKGRIPNKQEGFPGHWVLAFSSSFAPTTVNANGTAPVEANSIKCGHYVQVNGSVGGNDSTNQPGVFVNHRFVAHSGYGPEISQGPDASQAGFGQAPLPAGASSTPVAALPAGQTQAAPATPQAPVVMQQPAVPVATLPQVSPPPPAAQTVQPHTAFLTPAPPPPAPPAASGPQMTEKAGTFTYSQMIASGWTHAQLVEHGYVRAA